MASSPDGLALPSFPSLAFPSVDASHLQASKSADRKTATQDLEDKYKHSAPRGPPGELGRQGTGNFLPCLACSGMLGHRAVPDWIRHCGIRRTAIRHTQTPRALDGPVGFLLSCFAQSKVAVCKPKTKVARNIVTATHHHCHCCHYHYDHYIVNSSTLPQFFTLQLPLLCPHLPPPTLLWYRMLPVPRHETLRHSSPSRILRNHRASTVSRISGSNRLRNRRFSSPR